MDSLAKITKGLKMKFSACLTGLLLSFSTVPVMAGSITDTGSAHNFSASGWSGGENRERSRVRSGGGLETGAAGRYGDDC